MMDDSEDRALVRNYTACYLENSRSARRSSAAFGTITTGEIGPADSAGSLMIPAIPGGLLPTLRLGRNQRTYKYSCPVGLQIPFFILSKDVPQAPKPQFADRLWQGSPRHRSQAPDRSCRGRDGGCHLPGPKRPQRTCTYSRRAGLGTDSKPGRVRRGRTQARTQGECQLLDLGAILTLS